MPIPTSIIAPIRSTAHYFDQPQVINWTNGAVSKVGVHALFPLIMAYDLYKASPEKRMDVLKEDAFVLAPTWAATKLSLSELAETADLMDPITKLKNYGELSKKYPSLRKLFTKTESNAQGVFRGYLKRSEIGEIVSTIYNSKQAKTLVRNENGQLVSQASRHLEQIFPLPGEHEHGSIISGMLKKPVDMIKRAFNMPVVKEHVHHHVHEAPTTSLGKMITKVIPPHVWEDKMVKFFTLGGLIVVAGLVGGLVADAYRGIHEKKAKVDKIKEGIFQFIANIAMCAVGATVGMTVADAVFPESLMKTKPPQLIRGLRFASIMGGLCIGIIGGGYIANWVGRKFVNPFFDWMDNRHKGMTFGEAMQKAKNQNDRKVEFADAILHLDDLPTALALAGVQIFVPFIPLFFAFSGFRAGKGYRNQAEKKPTAQPQYSTASYNAAQRQYALQNALKTMTPQQMAQLQQMLMQSRQQAASSY